MEWLVPFSTPMRILNTGFNDKELENLARWISILIPNEVEVPTDKLWVWNSVGSQRHFFLLLHPDSWFNYH